MIRTFLVLGVIAGISIEVSAQADGIKVPENVATIQAAMELCGTDGEWLVLVAPGVYHETIDFLGKPCILRSTDGPAVTTIDGSGLNDSVVKCVSGEGPDTVLEGFTISGGTGSSNSSACPGGLNTPQGGGMLNINSSPTVTDCVFTGNHATDGGGMLNCTSNPIVSGTEFIGNTSAAHGAGMMNRDGSSPKIANCKFVDNTCEGHTGGGMHNFNDSNPIIVNCVFSGNTAGDAVPNGGGMENRESSPTLLNCTFVGNMASGRGGGMHNVDGSLPTIVNSIFWGNSDEEGADESAQVDDESGSASDITFSVLENCAMFCNQPQNHNTGEDCLLVGARPSPNSQCIDSGDNIGFLSFALDHGGFMPTGDLDGKARFWDHRATPDTGTGCVAIIDRGAFEYQPLCQGDLNGDGKVDAADLAMLLGTWGACPY